MILAFDIPRYLSPAMISTLNDPSCSSFHSHPEVEVASDDTDLRPLLDKLLRHLRKFLKLVIRHLDRLVRPQNIDDAAFTVLCHVVVDEIAVRWRWICPPLARARALSGSVPRYTSQIRERENRSAQGRASSPHVALQAVSTVSSRRCR